MLGHLKGRTEGAMAAGIAGARKALANRSISSAPFSIAATLRASPSSSSPSVRAFARLPRGRLPFGISRSPVELGCAQSLMPFHSATATALLTSMLSTRPGGWTWLSEGFATPL
ncbi:protein NUCLEAR FUSION DEFECTIVE 6, mitochondrial-like [Musa acuminata AAA Group]|uniref:protein NUCLEAR FUSION DEFECTIVE 6, mitochondrial-like n=1 Tax=Musa acuminata AAA Group TaxID=214697 RepID=UPI0031D0A809